MWNSNLFGLVGDVKKFNIKEGNKNCPYDLVFTGHLAIYQSSKNVIVEVKEMFIDRVG